MTIDPEFLSLLPIEGLRVEEGASAWTTSIVGTPRGKTNPEGDALLYKLAFISDEDGASGRTLRLWLSECGLRSDTNGSYKRRAVSVVGYWLQGEETNGELRCM